MNGILFYPLQYLSLFYVLLYSVWLLRENKAILFWLYLWQLKEYHVGRFLAHFSTSKGKRIFLNPLFFLKAALLLAAAGYYFFITLKFDRLSFFSPAFSIFNLYYLYAIYAFSAAVFLVFSFEAVWAAISFFRNGLAHPVLTKKSVALIVLTHLWAFSFVVFLYQKILGEMSLVDLASAAFILLLADILTPAVVSVIVLLFQPFAVYQRNKILKKAKERRACLGSLEVVGVAGSYGKSSTKEFLAAILGEKGRTAKTAANQNSEVGVSLAILNDVKPEHRFFVCEIGAYNKGRIKYVAAISKPKIGILAGINQQHMATFGSQRKIIEGKYEILEVLPEDGTAILNWDSDLVRQSYESQKSRIRAKKIIFCSGKEKKDFYAHDIKAEKDGLFFRITSAEGESADFNLKIFGRHNVESILLAAAAARTLGMSLKEIAKACEKVKPSLAGLKKINGAKGETIIDSTYSTNPAAVLSHLDYIRLWGGKKAIIMPCLIELGKSSKEIHREIGKKIGETCDLAIIASSDRFKEIKTGAVGAGMKPESIVFLDEPRKITEKVKGFLGRDNVILLEGRLPRILIDTLIQKN